MPFGKPDDISAELQSILQSKVAINAFDSSMRDDADQHAGMKGRLPTVTRATPFQ
jgi:hypothetical protein